MSNLSSLKENLAEMSRRPLTEGEKKLLQEAQSNPELKRELLLQVFQEEPVDVGTFVDSPKYLNQSQYVFYTIKLILAEIFHPKIRETTVISGLGSGKSSIGAIFQGYNAYWLDNLKNPQAYYGLRPSSKIALINVATSAAQAQAVIFDDFLSMLRDSPYFEGKFLQRKRDLMFPGKKIFALSGHSGSISWKGYNTFSGVMDEADFFYDKQGRSNADVMKDVLLGSMTTRFPYGYRFLAISSVNNENSHMMRAYKESARVGIPFEIPIHHIDDTNLEIEQWQPSQNPPPPPTPPAK